MMIINKKASRSREAFFWFYLDIISLLYIFKFWISVDKKLLILSIINGLYNNVIFFRGILFELCN